MEEKIKKLQKIFKTYPEIKLAYFFGSQAEGTAGPTSDYDFAFYIDERDSLKIFKIKTRLLNEISSILLTDKIDVVILDSVNSPDLKYEIIRNGHLIFEREPFKVEIEPKILNEYFDFNYILAKNNLTKAKIKL